jgi:hypothetical protein
MRWLVKRIEVIFEEMILCVVKYRNEMLDVGSCDGQLVLFLMQGMKVSIQ